jgi:fructose-1-phosphate kinase PfkB-like protein
MATLLTLTANTLLDGLASAPDAVVPGSVSRVSQFRWTAGGKGLNVGRVLVRFGHRVIAAGFAGGWSGTELVSSVAADGLRPLFVATRARTRIGFQVASPSERPVAVVEHGFAVASDERARLVDAVRTHLSGIDLVLVSGSVPDPTCDSLYVDILRACAEKDVPCWMDSYGRAAELALECEFANRAWAGIVAGKFT